MIVSSGVAAVMPGLRTFIRLRALRLSVAVGGAAGTIAGVFLSETFRGKSNMKGE